jgi:CHRD domain-containing protein
VPKLAVKAPGARGSFSATLMDDGTVRYTLSFRGLTGAAQAAHIHLGRPGKAGPVAAALCGPCRSGRSGSVSVTAAQVRAIRNGGAYVNVHTAKNPNGEIRGQIRKG